LYRFIERKLQQASESEKALIFSEIESAACDLMMHRFGSRVIQKFFEFGTTKQIQSLMQQLCGRVVKMSLHKVGCQVICTALASIPLDMKVS